MKTHEQYKLELARDIHEIREAWRQVDVELTEDQAEDLWGEYSNSVCAGWIGPLHLYWDAPSIRSATEEFLTNVLPQSH